ncbi:hypothetical protein GCM10011428_70740 [Streptomyces violaceus]
MQGRMGESRIEFNWTRRPAPVSPTGGGACLRCIALVTVVTLVYLTVPAARPALWPSSGSPTSPPCCSAGASTAPPIAGPGGSWPAGRPPSSRATLTRLSERFPLRLKG